MRISQMYIQSLAHRSVTESRQKLVDKQQIAASGRRVEVPSDDPEGSSRARLLTGLLGESRSYLENIAFGKLRLNRAEDALAEAENLFIRVKELTYSTATGTASAQQRLLAATEVDQLRNNLIDLANTKQGNEYIFANFATSTAPVATDGTVSWSTATGIREVEIGPSKVGEISASAQDAFDSPGGVNVFDVLEDMANDLRADDTDALRANVDDVETGFSQILSERVKVGVRTNRMESAKVSAEQAETLYETLLSNVVDADAAEAFSALSLAQTSLQAAITVSSKMFGPTLLNSI